MARIREAQLKRIKRQVSVVERVPDIGRKALEDIAVWAR
jgi:hypothetical protein